MSGGGNSQYGSGGGMPMYRGGGYQPQNQNATFRNALDYGNARMGMMPSFQGGQSGQYGRSGSNMGGFPPGGYQPPGVSAGGGAPQTGGAFPGSEGWTGFGPKAGGRDYVYGEPDAQRADYRPPGAPPIPTVTQPPQTGGMTPAEGFINQPRMPVNLAPPQQNLAQQNYNSVAGFQMPQSLQSQPQQPPQTANNILPGISQTPTAGGYANPWGFSQQQLGPSFNPGGSPRGGYFGNNMQYVPNVGNARNGLDDMARWGQNWDSQPFTRGPLIR
jgi:hypothetical protein